MDRHTDTPFDPSTDTELIAEFCLQADVADRTRYKYRIHLDEFYRWLVHPRSRRNGGSLVDVTRADVTRFMAYLQSGLRFAAPTHHCIKGELAASSRKNFLSSIHALYEYLLSIDLVRANPTAGIPRPKVRVRPGLLLTVDEVRRLLDAPGSPRDRIQAYLLAFTAARTIELRRLRWKDVDWESRTMRLHGKGDKYRVIDIHPRLMPELRRWSLYVHHKAETNEDMARALRSSDADWVLMTRSGAALTRGTIAKMVKRRATRAGLHVLPGKHGEHRSEVSPHALRRSFATILLNDGHHIDAVADVLGHRSVDTTRKHYAFSSTARRKATIEGFNA